MGVARLSAHALQEGLMQAEWGTAGLGDAARLPGLQERQSRLPQGHSHSENSSPVLAGQSSESYTLQLT